MRDVPVAAGDPDHDRFSDADEGRMIATEGPAIDGAIVVGFDGHLTVATAPTVRKALLRCFARTPEIVVADVSKLAVTNRAVLAVFPAAHRHGADPATQLMLCSPTASLRQLMTGRILGTLQVYDSCEQAISSARTRPATVRRMTLHLWPTAMAPSAAREAVVNACRAWHIEDLSDNAALVVSELVTNAVAHARTDIDVTFALRRDYLHIGVRDRAAVPDEVSDRLPDKHDESGRGLYFVGVFAAAWGMSARPDGKTVWATLRAKPRRQRGS